MWATNFYTVVLNICESSIWNLVHVSLLTPTILWWSLEFCGTLGIPVLRHYFDGCRIARIKPRYGICISFGLEMKLRNLKFTLR